MLKDKPNLYILHIMFVHIVFYMEYPMLCHNLFTTCKREKLQFKCVLYCTKNMISYHINVMTFVKLYIVLI